MNPLLLPLPGVEVKIHQPDKNGVEKFNQKE
jgi:hypothetical protein